MTTFFPRSTLVALAVVGAVPHITSLAAADFRRGDSNCDQALDLSDSVFTLGWLFQGSGAPCCIKAADANDDGVVDLSDAVYVLGFLFTSGTPPVAPHPECGADPTTDDLTCAAYPACEPVDLGPEIREWPVPWANTRPRDPYVGADGRAWFVGQQGNYVAYLEPGSGEFKRYPLPSGAAPHNVIVGADVWYAGNGDAHIGKLDPEDGEVTPFEMPDPAARDPHTLIFDASGDIWFTVQSGNFVGKLTVGTGVVDLIPVPTRNARPYGIDLDSTGRPWVAEFGTNKLGVVDPVAMEIRELTLPSAGARPRRLAITSDDEVWYVDYARGYLGRLSPGTGEVKEWPAPAGSISLPYGMAVDDLDRLWFVETGPSPNRLVGFNPRTEKFFGQTNIPSGGGTVRHMYFHAPAREIWFGTDTNTIGRARLR